PARGSLAESLATFLKALRYLCFRTKPELQRRHIVSRGPLGEWPGQKNDGVSEGSRRKQKRPRRSGTGVKSLCEEKLCVARCSGFLGGFCCLRRGRSLTAPLRLRRGPRAFPQQLCRP